MKLFDLYSWATGSMNEFAKPFQENPALYQKAKNCWRALESNSWIFILIFIVLGILIAEMYYKKISERPGRKYHPKYWALSGAGTLIATWVLTEIVAWSMLGNSMSGSVSIALIIASLNTFYAACIYFFTSVFCCKFQTTCAYRLF